MKLNIAFWTGIIGGAIVLFTLEVVKPLSLPAWDLPFVLVLAVMIGIIAYAGLTKQDPGSAAHYGIVVVCICVLILSVLKPTLDPTFGHNLVYGLFALVSGLLLWTTLNRSSS